MGLGNGNPKEGDKGSNFNFELKVLQSLDAIATALDGGGGPTPVPLFDAGCFTPTITSNEIFNPPTITVQECYYVKVKNVVQTYITFEISSGILIADDFFIDLNGGYPPLPPGGLTNIFGSATRSEPGGDLIKLKVGNFGGNIVQIGVQNAVATIDSTYSVIITYPYEPC